MGKDGEPVNNLNKDHGNTHVVKNQSDPGSILGRSGCEYFVEPRALLARYIGSHGINIEQPPSC